MLAFPIASGLAGFFPSIVTFLVAWSFMTIASFYLLEVNLRFGCDVSLVTMAEKTLGRWASVLTWVVFLFLFYALCVAYITGTTSLLDGVFKLHFKWEVEGWKISLVSTLVVGFIIFFGHWLTVTLNRLLMFGLVISYVGLVVIIAPHIEVQNLTHVNGSNALLSLPIMMVAFGFQNLIPSLTDIYQADVVKMKKVIWGGGLFALFIYLVWQLIVQGVLPLKGPYGIVDSIQEGREAAQSLVYTTKRTGLKAFAWVFAFFAIATSFIAQSLSIFDFISDGLQITRDTFYKRVVLILLALGPPFLVALIWPKLFIAALSFAGGICAMILFGILPALMCLKGRVEEPIAQYRARGGKPLIYTVIAVSTVVILIELLKEMDLWRFEL